jgi:hypothetical protein
MAARKQLIRNRNHYAQVLTTLEGGKSSIKMGDMRQALRLVVEFEAELYRRGYKSALLILRREAVEKGKKK